jgi:hypothetical protein
MSVFTLLSLWLVPLAASQPAPDTAAAGAQPAASQPAPAASQPAPAASQPAAPATPENKDHVAAVKQSLQSSMAALRQYQWIETTIVSMKGEEKSRTQNNCAYGPDGKVQKTPLAPAAEEEKKKGLRGKAVEKKKGEISDAVKEAMALIKQYVPPDPARIQAAKVGGRVMVSTPDPAGQIHVVIKDYLKAGDSITMDVNAASDRIAGVTVATFTEKKDPVGLKLTYGALEDGTLYPAKTQLDIPSQNLMLGTENASYKKIGT